MTLHDELADAIADVTRGTLAATLRDLADAGDRQAAEFEQVRDTTPTAEVAHYEAHGAARALRGFARGIRKGLGDE